MAKLEGVVQTQIINYLKKHRIYFIRTQAGNSIGLPDLLVCYKGLFIGLELKREDGKGRTTEIQQQHLNAISENGGFAGVVSSFKEFLDFLAYVDSHFLDDYYEEEVLPLV